MKTKICRICKKEKDINNFYLHKRYKGGHRNECKRCASSLKYAYWIKKRGPVYCIICGKEITTERKLKYCPVCRRKEKLKNIRKRWHERYNNDINFVKKESKRKKIWYQKNLESRRKKSKEYYYKTRKLKKPPKVQLST